MSPLPALPGTLCALRTMSPGKGCRARRPLPLNPGPAEWVPCSGVLGQENAEQPLAVLPRTWSTTFSKASSAEEPPWWS